MSAPKTPEGRAAALAKRRETARPKPLRELSAAAEHLATLFKHCADDCPPETETVGWIIALLTQYVTTKPLPEGCNKRLEEFGYALCNLGSKLPPHRIVVTADRRGVEALADAIEKRAEYLRAAEALHVLERRQDAALSDAEEATVARLLGARREARP